LDQVHAGPAIRIPLSVSFVYVYTKGAIILDVIPAKAGIHGECEAWIPAFAGMTSRGNAAKGKFMST
jgi:hypothetical protein